METMQKERTGQMEITISVDELLIKKTKEYRKNTVQQTRNEALQAILDFKPMESTELSEDTVRKERYKIDTRK